MVNGHKTHSCVEEEKKKAFKIIAKEISIRSNAPIRVAALVRRQTSCIFTITSVSYLTRPRPGGVGVPLLPLVGWESRGFDSRCVGFFIRSLILIVENVRA